MRGLTLNLSGDRSTLQVSISRNDAGRCVAHCSSCVARESSREPRGRMGTAPLAPGFSARLPRMTIPPNEAPLEQGELVLVVSEVCPANTVLEVLENEAREAKKGLWADPRPVPPWEWRKRSR